MLQCVVPKLRAPLKAVSKAPQRLHSFCYEVLSGSAPHPGMKSHQHFPTYSFLSHSALATLNQGPNVYSTSEALLQSSLCLTSSHGLVLS